MIIDSTLQLPVSKSLFNRALILQSFYPQLMIQGESQAEDVLTMKVALNAFATCSSNHDALTLDCGSGGTTLRFLLSRVSRKPGVYHLQAKERLWERPQKPLIQALEQLGVSLEVLSSTTVQLKSSGWCWNKPIVVDSSVSSQFISSLVLSAWELPQDLVLVFEGEIVSQSYLQMTLDFLRPLGLQVECKKNQIIIFGQQHFNAPELLTIEPDMSCAFALAAFAAVRGELCLQGLPQQSLQPDGIFPDLLARMGAGVESRNRNKNTQDLYIKAPSASLKPLEWSLSRQPDLFPILAVLLSQASGPSILTDLEVLQYKESNRFLKVQELLDRLGRSYKVESGKMILMGRHERASNTKIQSFLFDPDQDHRMAMAAAVARFQGAPIQILHPEVVNKSFPSFWSLIPNA